MTTTGLQREPTVPRRRRRPAAPGVAAVALVVVLVAALIVGSTHHRNDTSPGASSVTGGSASGLIGPTWYLTSWTRNGVRSDASGVLVSVRLSADGYVGSDGCNTVHGDSSVGVTAVTVHQPGPMTLMGCDHHGSQGVLPGLFVTGSTGWDVHDDVLSLSRGGLVARFSNRPDEGILAGTAWVMMSWTLAGQPHDATDVMPVRLTITRTPTIGMTSGCDSRTAHVAVNGARLLLSSFTSSSSSPPCSTPHLVVLSTIDAVLHDGPTPWTLDRSLLTLQRGPLTVTFSPVPGH